MVIWTESDPKRRPYVPPPAPRPEPPDIGKALLVVLLFPLVALVWLLSVLTGGGGRR